MMTLVWIFVLTVYLSSGPFVVKYGPYQTQATCKRDRAAAILSMSTLKVGYIPYGGWDMTVCHQVDKSTLRFEP